MGRPRHPGDPWGPGGRITDSDGGRLRRDEAAVQRLLPDGYAPPSPGAGRWDDRVLRNARAPLRPEHGRVQGGRAGRRSQCLIGGSIPARTEVHGRLLRGRCHDKVSQDRGTLLNAAPVGTWRESHYSTAWFPARRMRPRSRKHALPGRSHARRQARELRPHKPLLITLSGTVQCQLPPTRRRRSAGSRRPSGRRWWSLGFRL